MAISLPGLPTIKPTMTQLLNQMGSNTKTAWLTNNIPGTITRTTYQSSGSNTGAGSLAASLFGTSSGSGGTSYSSGGTSYSAPRTTSYSAPRTTSTRTSGGGGAVSSASWTCPSGATLTRESNGSGNLVCRWNHSGAEFAAIPSVGSAAPTPAPGAALPPGQAPGVDAPADTAKWLQTAKDTFAQNPEAMLADMLLQKYGPQSNNQLYRQLEPYADAVNAMFLMQNGLNADSGTGDDFLNYTEDYWNTLQTPGKRLDYNTALANLFATPGDNPLGAYVTDDDATKQSGNVMRLLSGAVEGKYANIMASPIMKQLDLARQRYIGESARNPDIGNYIAWLQANNPDLVRQLLA